MSLLLVAASGVNLVTAASFVAVGSALRRRGLTGSDRAAVAGFVTWWWAMAGYLVLQAGIGFIGALGWVSVAGAASVRLVSGPLLALATWGLLRYLLYLYGAGRAVPWVLGCYFACVAFAYNFMTVDGEPVGVHVGTYQVSVVHAMEPAGAVWVLVLMSFGLPIVGGAIAYLALLRTVSARPQRVRIVGVAVSLILWVSGGFAGQLVDNALARYASVTGLGLLTALVVYASYYPPRWLRRRWQSASRRVAPGASLR